MRLLTLALISLLFLANGCAAEAERDAASDQAEQAAAPAQIARVKVDRQGGVFLNGEAVSLEQLKQALARLKEHNGAVWYYRENPTGEPPPEAMAVIEAIIAEQLPVRMMDRDFE